MVSASMAGGPPEFTAHRFAMFARRKSLRGSDMATVGAGAATNHCGV